MKKITLLLNIFVLFLCFICDAKNKNDFEMINDSLESIQEFSVSFTFQENIENKGENVHIYSISDKDGNLVKELKVSLGKNLFLYKYLYSQNKVHYIYNNTGLKSFMNIVTIDLEEMKSIVVESETPYGGYLANKIVVIGDYICSKKNDTNTPTLRAINWKKGEQKVFPINIEGVTSMKLTTFEKTQNENSLFVNIFGLKNKKYANFLVKIDSSCVQSEFIELKEINESITNFTITLTYDGYLINGAYSINNDDKSSGIFISTGSSDVVSLTKIVSYLDIENFFEFTPKNTKKKALDMMKNRRVNTTTHFVDYNNSCLNLIKLKDGFIYIGDAYNPLYQGASSSGYSISTGAYLGGAAGGKVIVGYQFTHVFIVKFDLQGNMLWSRTFEASIKSNNKIQTETAPIVSSFMINDDNSIQVKYYHYNSIEKPKRSKSSQLSFSVPIVMKITKTIDENGILIE